MEKLWGENGKLRGVGRFISPRHCVTPPFRQGGQEKLFSLPLFLTPTSKLAGDPGEGEARAFLSFRSIARNLFS